MSLDHIKNDLLTAPSIEPIQEPTNSSESKRPCSKGIAQTTSSYANFQPVSKYSAAFIQNSIDDDDDPFGDIIFCSGHAVPSEKAFNEQLLKRQADEQRFFTLSGKQPTLWIKA